ncbi:TPA: flagellar hook-length control protein FliK [Burkholderia cenocepacia]|uniref:flagellar hook-length control protein FliK n=1 Tax=Burkholderia cenocepacia TaxID=95486 RepID=UPI001B9DF4FF|nr:flagellar hook-length control protein FliK [Burkholderia cenocepacia]MBR8200569.1 flagellar hook-length control protein FliK [Burkholderia cenocepacia]HDV6329833.1 flagellar hook-length control protein FliK [Burkholderia cenocepacia]HDV6355923.1 flagellar hook-length control protein FliK [Burkholderia cenocepacia]
MPPLPLLGALLDTAGAALKAARGSGASAANDASAATSAVPFAQTLKQSVATRGDTANAGTSDVSTKPAASKPTAGAKPSGTDDDKTTDDTTANATTNPDAAALAVAAAMQAQLQARPDPATPADAATAAAAIATQKTAVSGQPDATATLADHAAKDATAQPIDPASSRDALQAALAKLTGGAGAITMPATGTSAATPTAPAATASNAAAPLTPKVPTFDRTLADAKGVLATQQTPTQVTPQTLQADANAQSGAQHALAAASNATDPAASATLAAGATAAAAAQANLQLSPAAGAIAAANAHALAPHVGTADWTDALSQKVVFLSNAHQQSAELTLNPPDLGPLQVVLRVADNHAHALFVSQHAQVRDAVEAALPKLREAMEAGGLGLGSATVSDGGLASQQQQPNPQQTFAHGQSSRRGNGEPSAVDAPVDAAQSAPVAARASRAGLVDTFA